MRLISAVPIELNILRAQTNVLDPKESKIYEVETILFIPTEPAD